MAHEICHGKEHHLVLRVVYVGVVILVANFVGGVPLANLALFGLVFASRWSEQRADAYAGRTVGREAMVAALRRLAELNDSSLSDESQTHPALARRIKRLG